VIFLKIKNTIRAQLIRILFAVAVFWGCSSAFLGRSFKLKSLFLEVFPHIFKKLPCFLQYFYQYAVYTSIGQRIPYSFSIFAFIEKEIEKDLKSTSKWM
jgi:hypothetical protein